MAAYDYTVLAGTQGAMNHKKQDRFYRLAHELRPPLVLFAEGGGGRPGDTDNAHVGVSGVDLPTWFLFGGLSGLVPLIGIVHGRCFAGNAALLGCCDVIIATESATIGMGGPAMIEGGGLGVYEPEEIGPVGMQAPNGVIDVVVARRGRGGGRGQALSLLLPGTARRLEMRRPEAAALGDSGEPAARLRHPLGHPHAGRRGFGARTAVELRDRHRHRA